MSMMSALRYSGWPLKRKLFVSMLLLAVLVLTALASALILSGRTHSTAAVYRDALAMQMEVFGKDISAHFDQLAASAITLSEDMTAILEQTLAEEELPFSRLTDSESGIAGLQAAMIGPLHQKLLQTNCSGAFVMLDATVNSAHADAGRSRTGLYLQTGGYQIARPEVLLYRGLSDIGKENGIPPHRKWRLEFRTDLFPEYAEILAQAHEPPESAYRITKPFTLPGTSDQAILLTVPMRGRDGTLYGICGYEISAAYFTTYHTQPSVLPHLVCLLAVGRDDVLVTGEALHCGGADGYFYSLAESYRIRRIEKGFTLLCDDSFSYIGVTKRIALSAGGEEHLLAVMVPHADYRAARLRNTAGSCVLIVLLLFFTVSFCRFFSRRFLSPLLTALEQIQSDKRAEASSDIPEILDLIAYLDKQEKEHGETISALEQERRVSETEKLRLQTEYEHALSSFRKIEEEYSKAQTQLLRAQTEMERLAYSRKNEIDPADYAYFLDGLQTLTKSERNLFDYYLAGKSVPEILELTGIKESTLKYHNHNLLGKLGVSSRKQMLRYAEVMRHQNEEAQNS